MFNKIFDELKEEKHFKKITDIKSVMKKDVSRVFKNRGIFRTQASMYDGAFSEYT